jgi:hypothetical protein
MKIDQTYIGVGLLAVDLSQNNLGGPVPPELQSLTSLALFNGRNNMMSGNVPAWLGTLSRLQVSEQEDLGQIDHYPYFIINCLCIAMLTYSL